MGLKRGLSVAVIALVGALAFGALPAAATRSAPPPPATARLKAASPLPRCEDVPGARCGTVTVPLDRAHPDGRTIAIKYELWAHHDRTQAPLEPIVAVEGGPGYATRASRDSYLDLFGPLMDRRDLLLVDNRGTGDSGAINCPQLQSYVGDIPTNVGLCGQQLGDTADDYGTGNAVEDMIAVLDSLQITKINLYGDSYGTFFGQTFAVRHPERIRSLILDAAYPIEGGDPWYRDSTRAMRDAFRFACERAPSCASRGGDPIKRMGRMAARLRVAPIHGTAPDADGVPRTVTIDAAALSYLAWAAEGSPNIYRELDPAIRAALSPTNPDIAPLLRLGAENLNLGDAGDPVEFSEGLYAAVICHDYPQSWDPNAPLDVRQAQYQASLAALEHDDPDAFEPFTSAEWISQPFNEFDYCLRWPSASVADPPKPVGTPFPRVPTLVLTSDLDSNTSPEGARMVAAQFGGTLVESVNYGHVSALGDFGRCASTIARRFVQTLATGDTSCASQYNENRMVPSFPRTTAQMLGSTDDIRVARATVATGGDVIARWWSMYGYDGVGLRGGTFRTAGSRVVRIHLHDVKWVDDLSVRGVIIWHRDTGAIEAKLKGRRTDGTVARLVMSWNDWTPHARAAITGTVAGRPINLDVPAP